MRRSYAGRGRRLSARGLWFGSVRRGLGISIAFALVTASVAGCGSSGESVQSSTETPNVKRVPLSEFEGREARTYRDGREYCGLETKAELAVEEGLPPGSSDVVVARQFASEWPPKLRRAAFQGCLAGLATTPARFPRSSPLAEDLWDRSFIATSVNGRGGDTPPITQPLEIELSFSPEGRHSVGWGARCNSFGADVHFTPTTMVVDGAETTEIQCEPAIEREDRWLAKFMEANPGWRFEGEQLQLTSEGAIIELKEASDEQG